jgi:drug/metabolite transporter (DMT)-like permease
MLWIVTTVIASALQTGRNAMQSSLTAAIGTLGATQVRFLYGLPFAIVFLVLISAVSGETAPAPTAQFVAITVGAAIAQIGGTAFLLAAMHARSFSVATAFSKTEAVQVAVFGLALLGEHLSAARGAAIIIATTGVVLTAVKPGERWDSRSLRPALFGIVSGGCFAIASVGFRAGILELGAAPFFIRATTTLVWSLGIQAALLGAWMAVFARAALIGSFVLWRRSIVAGLLGALASQFWFLGFSLTTAANVRTLGLVEVLFAQAVALGLLGQRTTLRELAGMALLVTGVAWLLISS